MKLIQGFWYFKVKVVLLPIINTFLSFYLPKARHVTCNNFLQIMVCSCVVLSKCVLLIDPLTGKSRYFAQRSPIIVKSCYCYFIANSSMIKKRILMLISTSFPGLFPPTFKGKALGTRLMLICQKITPNHLSFDTYITPV